MHEKVYKEKNLVINNDEKLKSEASAVDEPTIDGEEDSLTVEDDRPDNLVVAQDEIELLQQKYNELNDSYLRLNAEFDNFRKRTIKEKADIIKSGGDRVLMGIITLVDDFERALFALQESEERDAMLEGMDLIYSKFINFLKQNGVEEILSIGEPFDGDIFEAVGTIPVEEKSKKGIVLDCIQKGYMLNDKIIRFPKVVVGD